MKISRGGGAAVMERPAPAKRRARAGALIVDREVQSFIAQLAASGLKPLYKMDYQEARDTLTYMQTGAVDKPDANIEDLTIPGGSAGDISIRIVRPVNVQEKLKPVMYFHGGGWILGDMNTHDRLIRDIADGSRAAVVFVNFTPAPEARFPVQIEQAYTATRYIAEQGGRFDLDTSRVAVAGDSVGGNMATVVCMLAKQRGGPRIDYQLLFYPVTDAAMDTYSYKHYADGPWLSKATMKWYWDAYLSKGAKAKDPLVSPLRASSEQLHGLPPAMVITDENDVLRDEGETYARKLMEAGVDVVAARFLGTIHDFLMLNPLADSPATHSAIALSCAHLRSALME